MKIACVTYRSWATEIYDQLKDFYKDKHSFLVINSKDEYNRKDILDFNADFILWYGWSWHVESIFIEKYNSIMLHPSPLPKYRGGSPIQNQIISGEKISAVTLFKMTNKLDDGDIYFQSDLSLEGSLNNILERIKDLGFILTCKIIDGNYKLSPQDESKATYFKRRKPEDSEITLSEIKLKSATYLHNKVRMLNDPYPNAYVTTADGKKLYIITTKID